MSDFKFESDESGKLIHCAHCHEKNLENSSDAKHCIHCGYSLLNECTNYNSCGKQIPVKAAYCPYCGSESHFLRSGLVESKRKIYVSDDDLPF